MLAAMKTNEEETKNIGGISQSQSSPAIVDLAKDPEGRKVSQSHSSVLMNGQSNGLDETVSMETNHRQFSVMMKIILRN